MIQTEQGLLGGVIEILNTSKLGAGATYSPLIEEVGFFVPGNKGNKEAAERQITVN